jgi:hypothetical protein
MLMDVLLAGGSNLSMETVANKSNPTSFQLRVRSYSEQGPL